MKWYDTNLGYGVITPNSDEDVVTGDIVVYSYSIVVSREHLFRQPGRRDGRPYRRLRYLVKNEHVSFSLANAREDSEYKYMAIDVRCANGGDLMCEIVRKSNASGVSNPDIVYRTA